MVVAREGQVQFRALQDFPDELMVKVAMLVEVECPITLGFGI